MIAEVSFFSPPTPSINGIDKLSGNPVTNIGITGGLFFTIQNGGALVTGGPLVILFRLGGVNYSFTSNTVPNDTILNRVKGRVRDNIAIFQGSNSRSLHDTGTQDTDFNLAHLRVPIIGSQLTTSNNDSQTLRFLITDSSNNPLFNIFVPDAAPIQIGTFNAVS
ncbi:hypothetical protein IC619_008265 [Hazenella sp. IB182353]|uniref:hypothetical protein n=1 Tax=Polycladospora coralii TaxID=2771432 RepID=UPI001746294F|nr:hypothetical protein [Polycladospora coralii]MBS7530482.1 hypothetical protein [Polycladospora coralii]